MKNAVIYHYPCYDGFASSWVFHHYKDYFSYEFDFIPINYGDDLVLNDIYHTIYIVDFSFSIEKLKYILHHHVKHKLYVLDHHKTAQNNLQPLIENPIPNLIIEFDMERAGCQITWDRITLDVIGKKLKRPKIIDYIADRDLWEWKLPYSKYINMYIAENRNITKNFNDFDNIIDKWDTLFMKMRQEGKTYIILQQKEMKKIINKCCHQSQIQCGKTKYKCILVQSNMYVSELGDYTNRIFGKEKNINIIGIYSYIPERKEFKVSFRSTIDDITPLVEYYNGGGHEHAGSCFLTIDEWDNIKIGRRLFVRYDKQY